MVQWSSTLGNLGEGIILVGMETQLPGTPGPGDRTLASVLHRHHAHVWFTYILAGNTH